MKIIKKIKSRAFTLIELTVVIAIICILAWATYINYSYYQNKISLKVTSKDITQALYNSRNMAINWLDYNSWNLSVGVYFDSAPTSNNKLTFFSYPYNFDFSSLDPVLDSKVKKIKDIVFQPWVQIDSVENYDKFLFVFNAITWSWNYYYWNSPSKSIFIWNQINLKISFKWATSPMLIKNIKYITSTNIVDY